MILTLLSAIDRVFQVLSNPLLLAGRLILAVFFLPAGWDKIGNYAKTAGEMTSHGIPAFLLPLVILLEIGGSLCVAFGFLTRLACLGLAIFTIMANQIFNSGSGDEVRQLVYLAENTIVAGLLAYMAVGPGKWSVDSMWLSKKD